MRSNGLVYKVAIKKATSPRAWYADKIGQVFTSSDDNEFGHIADETVKKEKASSEYKFIAFKDVEILEQIDPKEKKGKQSCTTTKSSSTTEPQSATSQMKKGGNSKVSRNASSVTSTMHLPAAVLLSSKQLSNASLPNSETLSAVPKESNQKSLQQKSKKPGTASNATVASPALQRGKTTVKQLVKKLKPKKQVIQSGISKTKK